MRRIIENRKEAICYRFVRRQRNVHYTKNIHTLTNLSTQREWNKNYQATNCAICLDLVNPFSGITAH